MSQGQSTLRHAHTSKLVAVEVIGMSDKPEKGSKGSKEGADCDGTEGTGALEDIGDAEKAGAAWRDATLIPAKISSISDEALESCAVFANGNGSAGADRGTGGLVNVGSAVGVTMTDWSCNSVILKQ
jgi:hypothetical protein